MKSRSLPPEWLLVALKLMLKNVYVLKISLMIINAEKRVTEQHVRSAEQGGNKQMADDAETDAKKNVNATSTTPVKLSAQLHTKPVAFLPLKLSLIHI